MPKLVLKKCFSYLREKLKIASRTTGELVTLSVSSAGSSPHSELVKVWYSATWQKHHFVYVITLSKDSSQGCKLFKYIVLGLFLVYFCHAASGILVPQPGIEPISSAVES